MEKKLRHFIQYLETQRVELERISKVVAKKPSPSAVHQLRITTRRIRAVIWLLKRTPDRLCFKALDHDLRKLGRALGATRELDVAIKDAKEFSLDSSPLEAKRKRNRKAIYPFVTGKRREKRSKKMVRVEKLLSTRNGLNLEQAYAVLNQSVNSLTRADIHRRTQLHQFRIIIKKTRYSLEAGGRPVRPLKRLQTLLGKARDLEVLEELLGKNPAVESKRSSLNTKALHLAKPALQATLREMATMKKPSPEA